MIPAIYKVPQTSGICYVNRVIDGDTLECDKMRIRLCSIDSPEKTQPYGKEATTLLTKLILNKNVRIVSNSLDIYGRVLGEVWIGKRLINAEMVWAGLAYTYGSCPTQMTILEAAEKSAKANKLNIWQKEQIRPWNYRRQMKMK